MLDAIFEDLRRDAHRPWIRRTSGGVLVALVAVAGLSMVLIEIVGR